MSTNRTTPSAAAHVVASMIACTSFDIVRQLVPKVVKVKDESGNEIERRTFVRTEEVLKRWPTVMSFEQRFAPLSVNEKTGRFERLHGRDKNYIVPFWFDRISLSANNLLKLMADCKDLEGVMPLVPVYAGKRCAEAKEGTVWSVPACPDSPHKPTLTKLDAASEFVADRAAFLGFRVHSALKSMYPSQYSARSNMTSADELIEIIERGVTLEEEGDRLEALTEKFDSFQAFDDHTTLAEAFGSLGNAANIASDNQLPLEEYSRIQPVAEAAANWYSWCAALPNGMEQFITNVMGKIEQAQEMAAAAQSGREKISYDLEGQDGLSS